MAPKKESSNSSTIAAAATTIAASSSSASNAAAEIAAAEQKQALYQANTKLCRLVKRCPWMYDRQHPNYAKKQIMDKSWAKIAKDCDDSVASCKERWRNMRAAFARSINIYKTNSGPNRVKPYYLHNELRFLITPMMEGRESKELDQIKADLDDSNAAEPQPENNASTPQASNAADTTATSTAQSQQQQSDVMSDIGGDFDFPEIEQSETPSIDEANSDIYNVANNSTTTATITPKVATEAVKTIEPNYRTAAEAAIAHMPHAYVSKRQKLTHDFPLLLQQQQQQQQQNYHHNISHSNGSSNFLSTTDADAKFLEALLPDMRAMNARQKIVFKRKIYQSLEEVFETSNDFPVNNSNQPAAAAAAATGVVTVTANSSAAQNVLRSIASLKENDMHKLQAFLQTIYRQRDGNNLQQQQQQQHTSSGGQAVTVIPRTQQQQRVGAPQANSTTVQCNGRPSQVQPISIKYELLDDDEEDVDDFE